MHRSNITLEIKIYTTEVVNKKPSNCHLHQPNLEKHAEKYSTSPPLPLSSSAPSRSGWILFLCERPRPTSSAPARRAPRQSPRWWGWRGENNPAKRRTWSRWNWTFRLFSTPINTHREHTQSLRLPTGPSDEKESLSWGRVCYWPAASGCPSSPESAAWRRTAETSWSCHSWCSHSLGSSVLLYRWNPPGRPWTHY